MMNLKKLKTLTIKKIPLSLVASRKKVGKHYVLEERYTQATALPGWWNQNYHLLREGRMIGGMGLKKWCVNCGALSEAGCKHNINK